MSARSLGQSVPGWGSKFISQPKTRHQAPLGLEEPNPFGGVNVREPQEQDQDGRPPGDRTGGHCAGRPGIPVNYCFFGWGRGMARRRSASVHISHGKRLLVSSGAFAFGGADVLGGVNGVVPGPSETGTTRVHTFIVTFPAPSTTDCGQTGTKFTTTLFAESVVR